MHSTKRGATQILGVILSGVLLSGLGVATSAQAHERSYDGHGRHGAHARAPSAARARLYEARHYDRRLDRRGSAIDHRLDFLAFVAAASGEFGLAYEFHRAGDRIERRLARRGDRTLRGARDDLRRPHGWKRHPRHSVRPCRHDHHGHGFGRRDRRRGDGHRKTFDHHRLGALERFRR